MPASGHARKQSKGEFCAIAGTPCPCGNDYVEVCRPAWGDTGLFEYAYRPAGTTAKVTKVFEAHHLLCVASVGKIIVGNTKIGPIVRQTKWCVNKADNMLAMPLWGHTVKWYCTPGRKLDFKAGVGAPPFAGIPQHDWDHTGDGGYIEELDPKLEAIAKAVSASAKKHEVAAQDLAADLDQLAKDFGAALKARGRRSGGTHAAWGQGRDSVGKPKPTGAATRSAEGVLEGRWYYPFSMAADGGVTAKGYPNLGFDQETLTKLNWLADKLKGLGGS